MAETRIPNIKKRDIYKLVRENVRIEDVIASYGYTLKKSGNNFVTLCPFHNDTKPSLSIQTSEQYFKCFTCGAKGTTIEFIIQMEQKNDPKFSFADAVIKLKNDFGLPIDIDNLEKQVEEQKYTVNGKKYSDDIIETVNMLEDISEKYEIYLTNTKQGIKHLEYLYSRGLTDETIKKFQLGFAPREATLKYFNNIDNEEFKNALIKTGMINEYKTDYETNLTEFFTDRITFPIKDAKGNTVGFTARTLDPRENSKYLNSRESEIFKKSELFFNWDKCIAEAYKENCIVLLEGNMDVIASDSLGLKNACGLNGVVLSNEQINMLKEANLPVILALDNDKAGHNATIKLSEMLEQEGIKVSIIDIGKYGNFKDNGDILMASMNNPELKEDFANKYISLGQSTFSFKLKYDYFFNKEVTPETIQKNYSKVEHELDSYKKVEFINYCQNNSTFSKEDIENIIDKRDLNENPYSKIGLTLMQPIINNIKIPTETKEKLIQDIADNTEKYLEVKGLSFQLKKEKMIEFIKENLPEQEENKTIFTPEDKTIVQNQNIENNNIPNNQPVQSIENAQNIQSNSNTQSNLNYQEYTDKPNISGQESKPVNHNYNRETQNISNTPRNTTRRKIDVFTIEGLKQLRRVDNLDDQIRQNGYKGYVIPNKIEQNFNKMCKQYSSYNYSNKSIEERKNELLQAYINIVSLKMFEGSNGKMELQFILKAADKFGLKLDLKRTNDAALKQMYQKATVNKNYDLAKKIIDIVSVDKTLINNIQYNNSQSNFQSQQSQQRQMMNNNQTNQNLQNNQYNKQNINNNSEKEIGDM